MSLTLVAEYMGVAFRDDLYISVLVAVIKNAGDRRVKGHVVNGAWFGYFSKTQTTIVYTRRTVPSRIVWLGNTERCPWERKFPIDLSLELPTIEPKFPFPVPRSYRVVEC